MRIEGGGGRGQIYRYDPALLRHRLTTDYTPTPRKPRHQRLAITPFSTLNLALFPLECDGIDTPTPGTEPIYA